MTPEEREAQHALEVAEKRLERLLKVADTVQEAVSSHREGQKHVCPGTIVCVRALLSTCAVPHTFL
jgi:hypothetical protein